MTKRTPQAIEPNDVARFVQDASDFDFEMRTLAALRKLGFQCLHSGVYRDPITGKVRQFDIRAERIDGSHRLSLAVECKNLRQSAPLLVSAVPRTSAEAFHSLLVSPQHAVQVRAQEVRGAETPYRVGEPVGKRTDQIKKDEKGNLSSDDAATFDKMSQALNSCHELVQKHCMSTSSIRTAIVPVLVVPDGSLWQVEYDDEGNLMKGPATVPSTSLFLDQMWQAEKAPFGPIDVRLSHLDVVTSGAIDSWVTGRFDGGGLFPTRG